MLGGRWCVLFFLFSLVFPECLPRFRERRIVGRVAESDCDYWRAGGRVGCAFVRRIVYEKPEPVGIWVKAWFCLVFAFVAGGGGKIFFSGGGGRPGPRFSGVCPVAPAPAGGATLTKHLGSVWQTWFDPLPQRGVLRSFHRVPPPFLNSRQSETFATPAPPTRPPWPPPPSCLPRAEAPAWPPVT